MGDAPYYPKTLQEAITFFSDPDRCFEFSVSFRWPDGVFCPFCDSAKNTLIRTRRIWKCKDCKKQFSVKIGTIFEDSPISMAKWFTAMWQLSNCKNGVSSYELHRAIGVTQKTAWFMLHRIREAMKAKSFDRKLSGTVETDECFIGGLFKNMHKERKEQVRAESDAKGAPTMRGAIGKTLVQAVLERDGEVRTQILASGHLGLRLGFIEANVEQGSELMTDEGNSSPAYGENFAHEYVNHQIEYVRGNVHCNGVENFWSLPSRMLHGTYVAVEPFHLSAYVDEQAFRFNNRKDDDGGRFVKALAMTKGCRLTYERLTRAEQA